MPTVYRNMPCGSLPLRKLQSTLLEICTLVWVAALAASMPAIAQPKPSSLRGVWRVAQLTTINSAGTTMRTPQPMLTIFTDKYYSFLWIQSDKPRPQIKDSASAARMNCALRGEHFQGRAGRMNFQASRSRFDRWWPRIQT
jgi:hypothetical protein